MNIASTVINPDNLRAIGFTEYDENGIKKYRRDQDIVWFTGSRLFTGHLDKSHTFATIAREILNKGK